MFKKGTIIYRGLVEVQNIDNRTGKTHTKKKKKILTVHEDIISNKFWKAHPEAIKDNTNM